MKPIGRKNYGSIPHLPNSRLGPSDRSCTEGQARIATVRPRDRHDRVIVQEKLDGSNVGVARVGDTLYALTRAGYLAITSPYVQHHMFDAWVRQPDNSTRFMDVLRDGERLAGEWIAQAHGTRYADVAEPFIAFDLMVDSTRLCFDDFYRRIFGVFDFPYTISDGDPLSVEYTMAQIQAKNHHNAIDEIEGAVWRVERYGKVDFLVKWVRPDKVDGKYLPGLSGQNEVWNWKPTE